MISMLNNIAKEAKLLFNPLEFKTVIDAHSWAFSKHESWIENLITPEYRALYNYCSNDYKSINPYLRASSREDSQEKNEKILNLSNCLSRVRIPSNIIVYRGTDKSALGDLQDLDYDKLKGKHIIDKAFMSTSMVRNVANKFDKGVLLKISVPAGSSGGYVGTISEKLEAEILFDKNQILRIDEVVQRENGIVLSCTMLLKSNREYLRRLF